MYEAYHPGLLNRTVANGAAPPEGAPFLPLAVVGVKLGGIPVQVHGDNVKTVLSQDVFGSMLMCQALGDSPTDSSPSAGDDCNPVVRLTHGGRMLREGCWSVKFPGHSRSASYGCVSSRERLCSGSKTISPRQSRARE